MAFDLINLSFSLIQKQAVNEIINCNDFTANFGLVLTHTQASELLETRTYFLRENGRIEIGGGTIDKIIKEFCDSPYISMYNYAETLHELIEIFYYYKNETIEIISDDGLIKLMKQAFDGACQGSLELLSGRELSKIARNLRYGYTPDHFENESIEEDEEDNYGEY